MTLRARSFTPLFSRWLSKWVKTNDYTDDAFFRADGADEATATARRRALDRLAAYFQQHHAKSIAWGTAIRNGLSDLRFTDAGRVPFPFARVMREKFNLCSVVTASAGPELRDLDGQWSLDVTGSYGVNVRDTTVIRSGWGKGLGACERSRPGPRTSAPDRGRKYYDLSNRSRSWTKSRFT